MPEKKYLDKMEWIPNTIYYIKAISRNPQYKPRTWEHEGKFGTFNTTDVKVARYNTVDKKYTEVGLFQFRIAKSILNEVQHKVDVDMPFYLRKSAGFNKEGKPITKYNIYNTPEEITDIQQDIFKEDIVKDIKQSRKDYAEGKVKTFEEIKRLPDITPKIEVSLDDIVGTLQSIDASLLNISESFREMLDKFSVKIKKER